MTLKLFDVNIFLGHPARGVFKPISYAPELLKEMDSLGVKKALVWHIAQYDYSPAEGNRLLVQAITGMNRLLGCWTILPPQTREVINDDFFTQMKKNRIFGLRVFPDFHRFVLNRVVFGNFLKEIAERRIPLLLSLERPGISWSSVYQLMEEYPTLTCILCDIGSWGANRYTWPLLETYPNFYIETSGLSAAEGGIEAMVGRFGSARIIFGTGFPEKYAQGPMLELLHCPIPDSDKEKIASGNLERLISLVKL